MTIDALLVNLVYLIVMLKLPYLSQLYQLCEYALFSLAVDIDVTLQVVVVSVALSREHTVLSTRLLLVAVNIGSALQTLRYVSSKEVLAVFASNSEWGLDMLYSNRRLGLLLLDIGSS